LPSVGATGDKLDGPENDDDGVLWTSALRVGQQASLIVTASTNGLLSAWLDFNADGDWADPGEQIFTNVLLTAGAHPPRPPPPPGPRRPPPALPRDSGSAPPPICPSPARPTTERSRITRWKSFPPVSRRASCRCASTKFWPD